MKKFVTNFLVALIFGTSSLAAPVAAASEFDGLYYPKGTKPPSGCKRIEQELHIGGMIIGDGTVYRGESVCMLTQPRKTEGGTEFVAQCGAEGDEYRSLLTITRIANGLAISDREGTTQWIECGSKQSDAVPQSSWTSGYAQGVSETTVTNSHGNAVTFSCGQGTTEPLVNIDFESNPKIDGPIDIVIDDQSFFFSVRNGLIKIDADCQKCMKTYGALMQALFEGRRMSVQPPISNSMTFDLSGTKKAFHGEVCENAGQLVKAAQRPCELVVDGKVIHSGQCSRSKDNSGETITAVERDTFVMVSYNDDGKSVAVYWNGPIGGTHAHVDLGVMRRDGSCWTNRQSSICVAD